MPPFFISQTMTITRFRTLPLREQATLKVDRENRVIYGVSVAQAVEAIGHGVALDSTTLQQLIELGNSKKTGVKSRFTHPGMSSDGMGKYLGRLKDFRKEGDKALADLHLSELASKSPSGDLGAYILDMAEEESDMFGLSVVIDMNKVWSLSDGQEIVIKDGMAVGKETTKQTERPTNAVNKIPLCRVKNLVACDVVDEPAANRDGLFSSALWASNVDAEQAFEQLDDVLSEWDVSPNKAYDVAIKYFNARGVNVHQLKGEEMPKENEAKETPVVTVEQFDALQAQMAALNERLAQAESEGAEAKAELSQYREALDAANERNAALEDKAQRERFTALSADWVGQDEKKVNLLVSMASAFGEDSEEFTNYVEQQNAIAAQLAESALFTEIGSGREPEGNSAKERLSKIAAEIVLDEKVSEAVAMQRATERNPRIYSEYVAEMRG